MVTHTPPPQTAVRRKLYVNRAVHCEYGVLSFEADAFWACPVIVPGISGKSETF
jgi:hypothetical protein